MARLGRAPEWGAAEAALFCRLPGIDGGDSSQRPSTEQRERERPGKPRRGHFPGFLVTVAVCLVAFSTTGLIGAASSAHAENLLLNGAFTAAAGTNPAGWGKDRWSGESGSAFEWKKTAHGIGIAVLKNPKPNDSRWVQHVPVKPNTWYRLQGLVRAIGVPEDQFGASIGILEGFTHAKPVKGADSGWQSVSLWFKTNAGQTNVRVACRLGNYGQITSGEAWCTGLEMEAQKKPPINTNYVYGPVDERTAPVGVPAVVAVALLLALVLGRYSRLPADVPWGEHLSLLAILLAILGLKVWLAPDYKYAVDVGSYSAWAVKLAQEGPSQFYEPGYFADYPPGYMYVLWGIGELGQWLGIRWDDPDFVRLLKMPAILADLAVSWLIFARLRPIGKTLAWTSCLAFALNPALVLNSAVWGQTDSVLSLLVLVAILLQGERLFELSFAFAALAILTKPQALLLTPLLVFWPWGWWKTGRPLSALLTALGIVFIVADPFRAGRSWQWLIELYSGTTGYYSETSVNAMNLAALLFGMRHNDAELILGITKQYWGFIIGFSVGTAFLIPYLMKRTRVLHLNLFAAATLVAFLCLTRMHERYLYPFFAFACLLGVTGRLGIGYWLLSGLFFINEYTVYAYQQTATAGPEALWMSVAGAKVLVMAYWVWLTWQISRGKLEPPGAAALDVDDAQWAHAVAQAEEPAPPAEAQPDAHDDAPPPPFRVPEVLALAGLAFVAFLLRVYNLSQPVDLVFDEVYFVEQGRNYLIGKDFMDPHPPLAKLSIGLGMWIFGDDPFGWRIMNAIVGTALVPLMYLLARSLMRRRPAAFAAAIMVAIDGLCLVDSRIAVIDVHYVTWGVAAYVATLHVIRRRDFHNVPKLLGIAVLIGLSVGAKLFIPFFSFLLIHGAIAVTGWQHAKTLGVSPVRYLFKPIMIVGWVAFAVYCLTFTPHFLWGWWHSPLDLFKYIVIDTPNYEAAVADATHPYSSEWWTWPLLLRPVWYFWKDPGPDPGTVVGIWGSGNPSIWWAALPALLLVTWIAIRERRFALGFIAAGWAIHLAPWIPIGRTLFLYHYFPSLLFAMLALAWLLDRLWHGEGTATERGLMGAALLGSLLPVAASTFPAFTVPLLILLLAGWGAVVFSHPQGDTTLGRGLIAIYAIAVLAISVYFLPIWMGVPITKQAWEARMWISGSSFMNWI